MPSIRATLPLPISTPSSSAWRPALRMSQRVPTTSVSYRTTRPRTNGHLAGAVAVDRADVEALVLEDDAAVGVAQGDRDGVATAHHDALDERLTAVVEAGHRRSLPGEARWAGSRARRQHKADHWRLTADVPSPRTGDTPMDARRLAILVLGVGLARCGLWGCVHALDHTCRGDTRADGRIPCRHPANRRHAGVGITHDRRRRHRGCPGGGGSPPRRCPPGPAGQVRPAEDRHCPRAPWARSRARPRGTPRRRSR